MEITYWADFTCPYSYIGSQNLMMALKNMEITADVFMKSYELNPNMPKDKSESSQQQLKEIDGLNPQQIKEQIENLNAYAALSKLPMDFAKARFCNTFDAHRLTCWAQKVDLAKSNTLISLIFNANFAKGEDIADHKILLQLAHEAGLNETEAKAVLDSDDYGNEVRAQEREADAIPVETIPYFIIDGVVVDHSDTLQGFEEILAQILKAKN